jgi:ribosomal subunit interface protein
MQYQISSDNMELTPSMEVLAKQKFFRIEKHLSEQDSQVSSIRVVLNKSKGAEGGFTVKGEIRIPGHEYFSDETSQSFEHALVKTVEEIDRMMQRDKDTQPHD